MKLCRFDNNRLGIVEGGEVLDVTRALSVIPEQRWPIAQGDPLIANLKRVLAAARKLAPVIGRRGSRIPKEKALDYVCAYSIGLDMTVRGPELQCFRKSIDTYSVLGPWLVTADEIADPNKLDLSI